MTRGKFWARILWVDVADAGLKCVRVMWAAGLF